MNIVSININNFLNKKSWKKVNENFVIEASGYLDKVVDYVRCNINKEDDIILLHEVPYKKERADNNIEYNKIFNNFKSKLEKYNLILEIPNYMNYRHAPNIITCAIRKENSNWEISKQSNYICSEYKGGRIYLNRVIELYNSEKNIYLLGVHIPPAYIKPEASVMWDDIIYFYKKLQNQNVIIMGDFNVYASNTIQKRKFNEIVSLGAIDAWTAKGNSDNKITYDDGGSGTRLDYAMMSLTAFLLLKDIEIDDTSREGEKEFTDHSAIKLLF